jgi:hypothetical protein
MTKKLKSLNLRLKIVVQFLLAFKILNYGMSICNTSHISQPGEDVMYFTNK